MKILAVTAMLAGLVAGSAFAQNNPAPATQNNPPANAASGTSSPAMLNKQDRDFVTRAAESNVSAMRLAELALQKATDPQVKQFAQQIADARKGTGEQLKNAVAPERILLPDHMSKDAIDTYDKLADSSAADFDRNYINAAVDQHQKDVQSFEDETKNGKVAALQSFAQNTLPTLQQHLKAAQQIKDQLANKQNK